MSSEGFSANEVDGMEDRIAETFSGKNVFVTGGTGFMGKVLVEKLLRKCPDIGSIILLVRIKKGKTPKQRLEEIFNGPLFEKVRNLRGGVDPLLEKMVIVAGDCQLPDLGVSASDRQMLSDCVHIVIHAAATIRFDEELKKAVLLNVRGTKLVVELAKECKKLELFIHISTAYCHLHEKLLEEKPYPPPADPHQIIQAVEWMDDETVAAVTPKLLNKLPNSYAFTKALGEALVVEAMEQGFPGMVLRPSIVIPIWQEPVPGWTDNINGPTGLLIGAGKGVIRSMYCKSNSYADYLPVDVFINGIMIAAWNYIKYGDKAANIINFTSSAEIKVTWSEMIDAGREIIMNRVPLNGVAWYPGGSMKHSRLYHNICLIFFHWIPAMIVDALLFCLGYKPVLMRVQRRISKGFEVFEYYTNNQWDFKSDIAQTVRQRLNTRERRDYKVDAIGLDISKYFEDCIRSARIFILKEYDHTLPAARRHMKVMWCVDLLVRCLFWGYLLYCMSGWMTSLYTSVVGASPDEMVQPTVMTS
ncbi:fatty acyl-CoA reductase 1 isoform X2 [Plutella xylostella]|uniref:fatty acyl-CoA reductase 1 isoform X1 n=1 Tax=Plutella xylostella TaxID=51655 RepID=UPI002032A2C1|nr:fatty acyl-CoA reductase 1 isoform X1 [Plutella xylostella]XP_048488007.1 fatty acyl-CoA reductase 1 isoform X2 [Plutella xylostella]